MPPDMILKDFRNQVREILNVSPKHAIMLVVGGNCCRLMAKTLSQSNIVDGAVVLLVTIEGSLGIQHVLDLVPEAADAIECATRLIRGDVSELQAASRLLQEETPPSAPCAAAAYGQIQSWSDVLSDDANTPHGEEVPMLLAASKIARDF